MVRRRDRHGRGLRGDLLPPHLPAHRTPTEEFDDLVMDSVDRLAGRWAEALASVDVVVEDVPPADPTEWVSGTPLGRAVPARRGGRAQLVVYRRPVLERADGDQPRVVHAAVVLQLASLLGRSPEDIDPEGDWDLS